MSDESTSPGTSIPIHLRPAVAKDVAALVPLLVRLKRLNEEFDPLLKVRDDVEARAKEVLQRDIENANAVVLAAEGVGADKDKVVGVVRALVRERPFYTPEREGVILDIYLLPLYRRKGVGEFLLREVTARLKELGAGVVTAEFPTQNEIAVRFYAKRGFRPITSLHARSV
ncbi:MAG: GNAT family N-acetyltransferase [Thermoplasmata archaeon]|nr:GNAT family N-acetyltransferase [Thermoplasmata archaeon]MCI4356352.1 GNAT family N-acetyltransferase [Thermoplasmata archaeon]